MRMGLSHAIVTRPPIVSHSSPKSSTGDDDERAHRTARRHMRSWFDARSPLTTFLRLLLSSSSRICFAFLSQLKVPRSAPRAYIYGALLRTSNERIGSFFNCGVVRCLCTASRPFLLCIFNGDSLGHRIVSSLLLLSTNNKKTMMKSQTNRILHDERKKKKLNIIDELLRQRRHRIVESVRNDSAID